VTYTPRIDLEKDWGEESDAYRAKWFSKEQIVAAWPCLPATDAIRAEIAR